VAHLHHGTRIPRRAGDKVVRVFPIFSPTRFRTRWQLRCIERRRRAGWTLRIRFPIKISAGGAEGFRGYGFKSNYQPGDWKVQVETTDGREIGGSTSSWTRPEWPRQLRKSTSSRRRSIGGSQTHELPLQRVDLREVAGEVVGAAALPRGLEGRGARRLRPARAAEVDDGQRDPASAGGSPPCARAMFATLRFQQRGRLSIAWLARRGVKALNQHEVGSLPWAF